MGAEPRPSAPQPCEYVRQSAAPFGFSCTEDHVEEWVHYLWTHSCLQELRYYCYLPPSQIFPGKKHRLPLYNGSLCFSCRPGSGYAFFLRAAAGIFSSARYLATVRREMWIPTPPSAAASASSDRGAALSSDRMNSRSCCLAVSADTDAPSFP